MAERRSTITETPGCCTGVVSSSLDSAKAVELAEGFNALADPVRLKILNLVGSAPEGEVCVCELMGPVGKSQGTVSHHLKVLSDAGLVHGDRRGKWVWYSLDRRRLSDLRDAL
jgi:ArsR family transcriptional regulator